MRVLAPEHLVLSYEHGAISLMWGGVERADAILDDVLDVLAHLAARCSETSPYR